MLKPYGKELILDLHHCDPTTYATRGQIEAFIVYLCAAIDMKREDLHWWDYEGQGEEYEAAPAHLKGTSAVQFITTSTIVIHTLDELGKVFINVFSCDDFDQEQVTALARRYFRGVVVTAHVVDRK